MNDNAIFCKFWKLNRCLTVVFFFFLKSRSDHKDIPDHSTDNQQTGYSQRKSSHFSSTQSGAIRFTVQYGYRECYGLTTISFPLSLSVVGGWFLPSNGPICPSSSPPQFTGSPGHSSGSYCERYSGLRSHRAAPYPSHYPHRSTTTSKARSWLMQPPWCTLGRNITNSFIIEVTSLQMEIQD